MKAKVPRIKEFPQDGENWRLDWFGAIEHNPNIPSEPFVQLSASPLTLPISELKEIGKDLSSTKSVDSEAQKFIKVGIGQFPMLSIGSTWHKGRSGPHYAGIKATLNNLLITSETTKIIPANYKHKGSSLIPFNYYRYGGIGSHSKLIAIEWEDDPFGILIPMMEVIRAYYAVSTDLAHAIFSGAFTHDLSSIINIERTGYIESEDRFMLGIRRDYSDEECWVIARILQSELAWKGATSINDQIMKDSLNKKISHPETIFPFEGLTNLKIRCKKIKCLSDNKWRTLVFAIDHCTAKFPFEHITVIRDNDNRKANPETDIPDEEKKPINIKTKPKKPPSEELEIQNQEETNKAYEPQYISLPSQRFGAIENKSIDKPEKDQCKYISKPKAFKDGVLKDLSTSPGGYANTGIGGLKVTPKNRKKALPASFEVFEQAILHLNSMSDITAKIRPMTDTTKNLPLTKPKDKSQWPYLSSADKTRRAVIAADMQYLNTWYTLVEFELRSSDKCKVALLSSECKNYLTDRQLSQVLLSLAWKKGIWDNIVNINSITINTLKHTWSNSNMFAESIFKRVSVIQL